MNQSILTGKMGVRAQQARLDIIGNNLSNVNTIGYKNVRADFKDALYQTLRRPVQPQDEMNLELGHGVLLGQTRRYQQGGSPQHTGIPTDMLLTYEGYFRIQSPQGEELYTRDGAFAISKEEDGQYLVMGQGWYVLDENGERIQVRGDVTNWRVSEEGVISEGVLVAPEEGEGNPAAAPEMTDVPYAQIGLYTFADLGGLEAVGSNLFRQTVSSGEPIAVSEELKVKQGYIEMSNTELASEMTRMIRTQRALQLNSRSITTADQMMGLANTIRR